MLEAMLVFVTIVMGNSLDYAFLRCHIVLFCRYCDILFCTVNMHDMDK